MNTSLRSSLIKQPTFCDATGGWFPQTRTQSLFMCFWGERRLGFGWGARGLMERDAPLYSLNVLSMFFSFQLATSLWFPREIIDFKTQRRERQRERKKKGLISKKARFFLHFFPSLCATSTWKCLISRSKEDVNKQQRNFISLYYIHFEITGCPCNLIGSQQCDLFLNRTIFCSKLHLFQIASFMF